METNKIKLIKIITQKKIYSLLFILILLCFFISCNYKQNENNLLFSSSNSDINKSLNDETELNEEKSKQNLVNNSLKYKKIYTKNENEINLLFSGDVLISRKTKIAYKNKGIKGIINQNYLNIINNNDAFIGNLECVISDKGEQEDKQWTFRASPSYVSILKDLNFDLMSIANNHTLDYGKTAFLDMLDILDDNQLGYVGGGKNYNEAINPFVIEANNKKIAIISTSIVLPSTSWVATKNNCGINDGYIDSVTRKQIINAKNNYDKVIVFVHWGKEKEYIANKSQNKYAHLYVDAGADLVVGSHSHTIQNLEYYKGVPIIYSLGNFIYGSTSTETSLLNVSFSIDDYGQIDDTKIRLYPGTSFYEYTKAYDKDNKKKFIYNLIFKSINCFYDEKTDCIYDLEKFKDIYDKQK